jgi:hypothetical protein
MVYVREGTKFWAEVHSEKGGTIAVFGVFEQNEAEEAKNLGLLDNL